MKNSNFKFGINNYRVFNSNQEFDFAPISLLVGPNNSGKSSVMKSLFTLKESMKGNRIPLELNFDWLENQINSLEDILNDPERPVEYYLNISSLYFGEGKLKLFYSGDYEDGMFLTKRLNPFLKRIIVEFEGKSLVDFEFNKRNVLNLTCDLNRIVKVVSSRIIDLIEFDKDCKLQEIAVYKMALDQHTSAPFIQPDFNRNVLFDNLLNSELYKIYERDFLDSGFGENLPFDIFKVHKTVKQKEVLNPEFNRAISSVERKEFIKVQNDLLKKFNEYLRIDQNNRNKKALEEYSVPKFYKRERNDTNARDFGFQVEDDFGRVIEDVIDSIGTEFSFLSLNKMPDFVFDSNGGHQYSELGRFIFDHLLPIELKFLDLKPSIFLSKMTKIPSVKVNKSRYFNIKEDNSFLSRSLRAFILARVGNRTGEPIAENYFENRFLEYWLKEFNIGVGLELNPNDSLFENELVSLYVIGYEGEKTNVVNMGTGVSQIISLILAPLLCMPESEWLTLNNGKEITIYLEEPESNLHPDWQSKLMELVVDINKTYGLNFVIETHSEYMVRKLQNLTASKDSKLKPEDSAIFYLNSPSIELEKGEQQVKRILIDGFGNLSDSFGKGFYDEALNLEFDLLQIRNFQNN